MTESWLTVCEVQDRLIEVGLGRLKDEREFVSEDVALGLSDRGLTVFVYDRTNLARVREAFRDAPRVTVRRGSRRRPLG